MKKKNKRRAATALLLCAALLGGCGHTQTSGETAQETPAAAATGAIDPGYTDRDLDGTWDASSSTVIVCGGAGAEITGGGAYAENGAVTITAAGTYVISGSLNGQLVVDASDTEKMQLVLNGISIQSADGPALYVKQADKVFLTLAENTENSLSDGAAYTLASGEDEPDAAVFSKDDLTINGAGTLTVTGNYDKGVRSKDDLKITGGVLNVTAAGDGIKGRDCVAVCGGVVTVNAGGDGIQSNNDEDAALGWVSLDGGVITIEAGGDGVQAQTTLQLTGGVLDITTGGGAKNGVNAAVNGLESFGGFGGMPGEMRPDGMGGGPRPDTGGGGMAQTPPDGAAPPELPAGAETGRTDSGAAVTASGSATDSFKGLKGGAAIYLIGAEITIDSADDAVHSNGSLTVEGGVLTAASGDDGLHADAALLVSGGTVTITGSYEGVEGASVTVSGGTLDVTASDDGFNAAGGN